MCTTHKPMVIPLTPDSWKTPHNGVYVREHVRPRKTLFTPQVTSSDGPDIRELLPLRLTVKHGQVNRSCDDWTQQAAASSAAEAWTGYTVFFGEGCDPKVDFSHLIEARSDPRVCVRLGNEDRDGFNHVHLKRYKVRGSNKVFNHTSNHQIFHLTRRWYVSNHLKHSAQVFWIPIRDLRQSHQMGAKGLKQWQHILTKLLLLMRNMVKQMVMTKIIREMKHRAPALMGYMQALTNLEMPAAEEMPPRPISRPQ